jgi:CRP/FNR family transcriptional regulator
MHVLIEGHVQLVKSAPDGSEVVIRTVNPGEAFAEVILFEQDRYPVTAQAVTAATTLSIRRSDILALLDNPAFREDFIALLMRRMRYLADRVRYLTMYDVEDRFVRFLEEQFGHETDITLTLSRKDIASAIGTTPETLSRLLHRLRTERVLDWDGKRLKLHKDFWLARQES